MRRPSYMRGRRMSDLSLDIEPPYYDDPAYDHDDEGDELMDLEAGDLGPTDPGDEYWEEVKHDNTQ